MTISYVVGDATKPAGYGKKIVAHVCNDIGAWGKGFVLSLSLVWPQVEADYRNWYQGNPPRESGSSPYPPFALGSVRCVPVPGDIWVANMIAQHGIMAKNGVPPIRYDALEKCLTTVAQLGADSVHMPRIGCGLSGGTWSDVEPIVAKCLRNVNVYVYDFKSTDRRYIPWQL